MVHIYTASENGLTERTLMRVCSILTYALNNCKCCINVRDPRLQSSAFYMLTHLHERHWNVRTRVVRILNCSSRVCTHIHTYTHSYHIDVQCKRQKDPSANSNLRICRVWICHALPWSQVFCEGICRWCASPIWCNDRR